MQLLMFWREMGSVNRWHYNWGGGGGGGGLVKAYDELDFAEAVRLTTYQFFGHVQLWRSPVLLGTLYIALKACQH